MSKPKVIPNTFLFKHYFKNCAMKNVQIIDGAINSIFEIYTVSDEVFLRLFPDGADVAFAEDFAHLDPIWSGFYKNRVPKKDVKGIHGTLHLIGKKEKTKFFPTKQEAKVVN